MHKCLFLFVFLVAFQAGNLFAQQRRTSQTGTATVHEYYIYISGADARADVESLENSIQKKPGVTYFLSYRYPALYYLLKSTEPVSQEQFSSWIGANRYKVEAFGEGIYNKEKAIVVGKKLRKLL